MISKIFYNFLSIFLVDRILVHLFGTKSRWFQLHCIVNFYIVIIVMKDAINLILSPFNLENISETNIDSITIVNLHIYHLIMFRNVSIEEYLHHFIFIILGVMPGIFLLDNRVCKIATFTGCGLPGCIEYFTLSLYKHNKLNNLFQKKIMIYIYNYFRSPLGIISMYINYIQYKYNGCKNIYFLFYINTLVYINSTYYNLHTSKLYYNKLIKYYYDLRI